MEKQFKSNGIILRRIDLAEADQILTILTEDQGKISLLAKGSRRLKSRLLGKIELLHNVQVTYFQGRELGHLNEVEGFNLVQEHELDLKARSLLFYMAEATNKLIAEEQECRSIYHHLKEALSSFDLNSAEAVFFGYLVKLLTELGFMGDWNKCAESNVKLDLTQPYFISRYDGSLVKNSDFSTLPVSPEVIKWVNYMQKEDFEKLKTIVSNEGERVEVFSILKSVLSTILNHPFKSEAFLKQV